MVGINEIWVNVKGYEGLYKVSNNGRVMSLTNTIKCRDGKVKNKNGRILKPSIGNRGYLHVNLSNGLIKQYTVHSLVARNFIKNENGFNEVDHINGVKTDNFVRNLKWCSRQGNLLSQNWTRKNGKKEARGVHYLKKRNKYLSSITINHKTKYLGTFDTEIEASSAYQKALHKIIK